MTEFVFYYAEAAICALGLVFIALFSKSRTSYLVVGLYTLCLAFGGLSVAALRGQPKATETETRNIEVAEVLWVKIVPEQHIYMILTWKGLKDPLYYVMPWDAKTGKEIADAHVKATARNVPLMLKDPFGKNNHKGKGQGKQGDGNKTRGDGIGSSGGDTDEGESFYPEPPPPLPVKPTYEQDYGL